MNCDYCETMRAHRLPDHGTEVYVLARADLLTIDGLTYERALDLADTIARRVARGEVDHGKVDGHWLQLAYVRGVTAELAPAELADHLEAHGNPAGAARIRAGQHPAQIAAQEATAR